MHISTLVTKPAFVRLGAVIIILAVGYLAFYHILALPFTGTDTLTLIDTSRIESLKDVQRILSQPMMAGTTFTDHLRYYRPVSVLSFSMDYILWGLNPWGYHLTNLLLHLASTLLCFFLFERISGGRTLFACLAAVLFTLHPVLSQSLPVISRRQDLLATMFSLLAMLLFVEGNAPGGKRKTIHHVLSLLFCIFAIGSKETGFLTPVFIVTYAFVYFEDPAAKWRTRATYALRMGATYLLAAAVLLMLRTSILGGLGFNPFGAMPLTLRGSIGTILDYFNSLVDPGETIYGRLKTVFTPGPSTFLMLGSFLALGLLFVFFGRQGAALRAWIAHQPSRVGRGVKRILLVLLFLALLVFLSYPLLAPLLGKVIEDAYEGRGIPFVVDAMQGRDRTPVESYLLRARNYAIGASYRIFIYALLILGWMDFFNPGNEGASEAWERLMWLMMLWLWLPLGLFIFTASASQRSMYFSVAIFASILIALLIRGLRMLKHEVDLSDQTSASAMRAAPWFLHVGIVSLVILVALVQVVRGPLFKPFTKWEQNGKFSSEFFDALDRELSDLPGDARLTIYGLPSVTESSIMDYTVKSWLDLTHPGNAMTVVMGDRVGQAGCESCLQLRIESREDNSYAVYVEFLIEADD